MDDDIVARLRELNTDDLVKAPAFSILNDIGEAADEIELLRKLVTEAGKSLSHVAVLADMMQKSEDELIEFHHSKCAEQFEKQGNEIERLQNELDKWRKIADALYLCGKCDWCREKYEKAVGDAGRSNP